MTEGRSNSEEFIRQSFDESDNDFSLDSFLTLTSPMIYPYLSLFVPELLIDIISKGVCGVGECIELMKEDRSKLQ